MFSKLHQRLKPIHIKFISSKQYNIHSYRSITTSFLRTTTHINPYNHIHTSITSNNKRYFANKTPNQTETHQLIDVVTQAQQLIDIESLSGYEFPMVHALQSWLEPRGWTVSQQHVKDERYNILAYPNTTSPNDIKLLFNTHIDTVPPYIPSSIVNTPSGKKLCGRGACDTKSLIAAQLFAADQLKNDGYKGIGLLYVVGEEVDHCGMIAANNLNLTPKYLIVGEPTESKIMRAQKGILKFELTSIGKEAHSGYPETGLSSINVLINILYEIIHHKWPVSDTIGNTTVNIGTLDSGVAANIIPNLSKCVVFFRCVTSPNIIEKKVLKMIDKHDLLKQISYNKISEAFPQEYCCLGNEYDTDIACFNTDIPYFKEYQNGNVIPVLFGCGSIKVAHTAEEYVMIDDLKTCVGSYYDIAMKLLSGKYDSFLKQEPIPKL